MARQSAIRIMELLADRSTEATTMTSCASTEVRPHAHWTYLLPTSIFRQQCENKDIAAPKYKLHHSNKRSIMLERRHDNRYVYMVRKTSTFITRCLEMDGSNLKT